MGMGTSSKTKLKKVLSFVLLLSLSLLGAWVYRPWIYRNGLFDFHLSDSFPSLFTVPVAYAFYDLIIKNKTTKKINAIILFSLGAYIYELLQLFGRGFDYYDCIAIAVGSICTYLFL